MDDCNRKVKHDGVTDRLTLWSAISYCKGGFSYIENICYIQCKSSPDKDIEKGISTNSRKQKNIAILYVSYSLQPEYFYNLTFGYL